MSDSAPKMKTVYLNGIAVGQVPAMGDLEKDREVAQQFLKDKGLYKETTLIQAMFRQAVSFCTTSAHLYEKDLKKVPRNGLSVAPFVVNCAFSLELYLKTLAQIHGVSLRGHKLIEIYDSLPPEAHKAIEAAIPGLTKKWKLSGNIILRDYISELNNAFVEWRYCYEVGQTNMVRIEPTIFAMEVLHDACRSSGKT